MDSGSFQYAVKLGGAPPQLRKHRLVPPAGRIDAQQLLGRRVQVRQPPLAINRQDRGWDIAQDIACIEAKLLERMLD